MGDFAFLPIYKTNRPQAFGGSKPPPYGNVPNHAAGVYGIRHRRNGINAKHCMASSRQACIEPPPYRKLATPHPPLRGPPVSPAGSVHSGSDCPPDCHSIPSCRFATHWRRLSAGASPRPTFSPFLRVARGADPYRFHLF